MTVTTTADPGFATNPLVYSFTGFPSFIDTGAAQTSTAPPSAAVYPAVTFGFTASATAPPGTYGGTLVASDAGGATLKTFPMAVVVQAAPAPTLRSLTPSSIARGTSALLFTLSGTGFQTGATVEISGTGVTVSQVQVASANLIQFTGAAAVDAALGGRTVTVTNPDGRSSNPVALTVVAPPPPVLTSLVPATIEQGASGVPFALAGSGFLPGATVAVSASGVVAADVQVVSGSQLTFSASAALSAAAGPRSITVTNPDGQTSNPVTLSVTPPPSPVLASVMPASILEGAAGVPFTVTGANFREGATVAATPPGLSISAVEVVSAAELRFTAAAASGAAAGPRMLRVTNPTGQTSNPVTVTITPRPPLITRVTPSSLATGVANAVVTLEGSNFRPGAMAASSDPAVAVHGTTVLSPSLARVTLSVRAESRPGPVTLTLRNADGGASEPPATLLVYPQSSMAAPLSITSIAIVYPMPGTLVATDEVVLPRGLLATTGTGTVVGTWRLDGVPFDRFVVTAVAGNPVDVRALVPIPPSVLGSHTLDLAIETPATGEVASITVVRTVAQASKLRLFAPEDGLVVTAAPLFRWSVVPGAEAYAVEIVREAPLWPLVFRTADTHWRPTPEQLAELGPGVHRWRVRALFPNGVPGKATAARRLVVLPASVVPELGPTGRDPASGRLRLSWSGGSPGLLYRVEILRGPEDTVVFQALTAAQEYLVPALAALGEGPLRVRVTALAPGGRRLGASSPAPVTVSAVPRDTGTGPRLAAAPPSVQSVSPPDGARVTTEQPRIAARWNGDVAMGTAVLLVDGTDVSQVSRWRPGAVTYDSLIPLDPGTHTVRLVLGKDAESTWTFAVEAAASAPPAPAPAPPTGGGEPAAAPGKPSPPAAPKSADWVLLTQGTVTASDADAGGGDNATAEVSLQTDVDGGRAFVRATADVVGRHELDDPHSTVQESRNWLVDAGARQGDTREELTVGFSVPRFAEGSELMTTGVARGAAGARISSPLGGLSVYHTFTSAPPGVVSGTAGPQQDLKAAAIETPESWKNVLLRAVAMKVEDQPGANSTGGDGTLYGALGRILVSSALQITFEAAHGRYTPNPGSAIGERSGTAFRLGFAGQLQWLSYALNIRRTDANFVNPANRGFTAGGVSDRQGADLQLNAAFGRSSVSAQLRYVEGGNTSGTTNTKAEEKGGAVQFTTILGSKVMFMVGGNTTAISAAADPAASLPGADSTFSGVNATLTETLGRFSLNQTLSWQDFSDGLNPTADSTTKNAALSASGRISDSFTLFGIVSATRMDSTAASRTDQTLLTIQPTWTLRSIGLVVQPLATYSRTATDLNDSTTVTEQYQALVSWTPPVIGRFLTVQVSGAWMRSRMSGAPSPGFTRRLGAALSFHWTAGSGTAGPAPQVTPFGPAPGTAPGVPMACLAPDRPAGPWR